MAAKVAPIPPPFFSPYLDDQCNKINSKPVPWEGWSKMGRADKKGYQRAKLVSAEEVQLLKSLSKLPPGQRNTAYSTQGAQYASLYVNLLRKLQRVDTVQAVLVAITEMLSDPSSSATTLPLYHNLRSSEQPDDPYGPLVKCLGQEEEFAVLAALRLLGLLVATDPQPFPESLLSPFLKSLSSLLNNARQPLWEVAAQVLGAVLSKKQFRSAVWKEEGCISGLVKALKGSPTPQAQYWAGLAVWELSFEEQAARGFDRKYQIIEVLTAVAKSAVKEKVSRMVIATFRNLLTLAPSQSLPSFFTNHTLELAQSLKARKWSDEDVTEDLDYLVGELKGRLEGLTTYDEYVSELESGKLVWSPTHESEDFWKENAGKVGGDEGGKGIKRLVELLKSSDDPLVLSIAASDIGQFIKYANVPDKAKATVADLGGKTRMIELMGHANPEVRYRALMSVQRLMSLHA